MQEQKAAADTAFGHGNFAEAVAGYSELVKAAEGKEASNEELRAFLSNVYSNRSAAYASLAKYEEALADAEKALELYPGWSKPHIRRGKALAELGRHREAAGAYAEALRADPTNAALKERLAATAQAAELQERSQPVQSVQHFATIFRCCSQTRLRLGTLATLWNESSLEERWQIFRAFLEIIGGKVAVGEDASAAPSVHISQFTPSNLVDLPMTNYADLTVPQTWTSFYTGPGMTPEKKVALFQSCWELCTETEKGLILLDVRLLFTPAEHGGGSGEAGAAAAGGSGGAAAAGAALEELSTEEEKKLLDELTASIRRMGGGKK